MRFLRRLMAMLLPWPTRHQRREAISNARREKERSQSSARHAATIERDIERIAEANHFADIIASQIVQQHRRGTR